MTYREFVIRNAANKDILTHAALGLPAEAGEFTDLIKKHLIYGRALDKEKCLLELGDVRWYLELALIALDSSIEEIEKLNTDKLNKRYPDGFTK